MENMADLQKLYFGGDLEAAIPLSRQVVGRIDEVIPAKQVIDDTMEVFHKVMHDLAKQYAWASR